MANDKPVFIVDDDVASAESLKALMSAGGISARVLHSAESFLAIYDGISEGCLILDIRLEGMSGLELQKILTNSHAPLAVVIVSGHADDADRQLAETQGAIAFFEKPFSGIELCELVWNAIDGSSS